MNKRIQQIRQRRELLVMRSDRQRFILARQIKPWRKALHAVDRAMGFIRRARTARTLITIALGVLAMTGRRRLGRMLRLGWSAWKTYRQFMKRIT